MKLHLLSGCLHRDDVDDVSSNDSTPMEGEEAAVCWKCVWCSVLQKTGLPSSSLPAHVSSAVGLLPRNSCYGGCD